RVPYGDAAVADARARVARAPEIAGDVGADAVGAAGHAVDGEIRELLEAANAAIVGNVAGVDAAGADDVEPLVVGREREPVRRPGQLIGADRDGDAAVRRDAVDVRRQLALRLADARGLPDALSQRALRIARSARRIRHAFVELAAVRRIGEPIAAVGVRHHVVRRIQRLAVESIREHGDGAVVLVAHDAAQQVLARDLPALEIERVAVAVVRRRAKHRDAAIILEPAQLSVVRDVAPDEVAALARPRRPFGPQRAGPEPLDRRVADAQG